MRTHLIYFFTCFLVLVSTAQNSKKTPTVDDADDHFFLHNYQAAIPIYETALQKEPEDSYLQYQLGICYLKTRINRKLAISYLENCAKLSKGKDELWMHLGKAYHIEGRLDEAISAYQKYALVKPKLSAEMNHYIAQCNNALVFMKSPANVQFQNLGPKINSPEPDYFPFVDRDETNLIFTTRRKDNFGGKKAEVDGYRSSDIYLSTVVDGEWTNVKNLGRTVNSNLDEHSIGLRPDGLEMYVYMDHIESYGNIYVSKRPDLQTDFTKPKIVDGKVNEKLETAGCMTDDGNVIFFTRRHSLKATSDLFMAHRVPNGTWGIPMQLPNNINTEYNEDMPYLSSDGKTLFFSSEGHNSMGGFDLFKCTWDEKTNTFSNPVNLGFPINSTDDDRSICLSRDNKLAYVSSFRPGGYGDLDIYRVKFLDGEQVSVIYTGNVNLGDSTEAPLAKYYDVRITVKDIETNYEYIFVPNHKSGRYIMALPEGKYKLVTYCNGFAKHEELLSVSDMGKINDERHKDLTLRKIKKDSSKN